MLSNLTSRFFALFFFKGRFGLRKLKSSVGTRRMEISWRRKLDHWGMKVWVFGLLDHPNGDEIIPTRIHSKFFFIDFCDESVVKPFFYPSSSVFLNTSLSLINSFRFIRCGISTSNCVRNILGSILTTLLTPFLRSHSR